MRYEVARKNIEKKQFGIRGLNYIDKVADEKTGVIYKVNEFGSNLYSLSMFVELPQELSSVEHFYLEYSIGEWIANYDEMLFKLSLKNKDLFHGQELLECVSRAIRFGQLPGIKNSKDMELNKKLLEEISKIDEALCIAK